MRPASGHIIAGNVPESGRTGGGHFCLGMWLHFLMDLLKCQILAGLLTPTKGEVYVRRPRSFVFQNPDHQVPSQILDI